MKVLIYDHQGKLVELNNVAAPTLMVAIRDAGLDLTAQCGGCASCGTCHVYVNGAWRGKLRPIGENEDAMLDALDDRGENSRLSCQIELTPDLDGLIVTLAPGSAFA
jgi:2Fe-2S ferredoxin